MIVFDGVSLAAEIEVRLKARAATLRARNLIPTIGAILFKGDAGSVLYTRLKKETAERIGIEYQVASFSLTDSDVLIQQHIQRLNADPHITGIIIQKPRKSLWKQVTDSDDFAIWWQSLVSQLNIAKDVDGLHPQTLAAVKAGNWRDQGFVLPATCRAVLTILNQAKSQNALKPRAHVAIIGKSDILGLPLAYELHNQGYEVDLLGSRELAALGDSGQWLHAADVVVSATGHKQLIRGEMIRQGAVVIDVGEPQPDVDFESVAARSAFITPVPGGVGPITVVSLLENSLDLLEKKHSFNSFA